MIDPRTASWGALLLRLSLGVMFIAHALLKYFVFTLPVTAKFFVALGFPGPLAYVVFAAELVGGAMLVLGVYARWVALALVPILIGAATVHWGNGWVFDNRRGGWEFPVFWAVALVVQFLIGDGSHALKRSRVARAWTGTLARTAAAPGAGPARG
jgi:putative oxidoreductase